MNLNKTIYLYIVNMLCVLPLVSSSLNAQTVEKQNVSRFGFGVKGGIIVSAFQDNTSDTNTGKSLGIFTDIPIYAFGKNKKKALISSIELNLVERGGIIHDAVVEYISGYYYADFSVSNQRFLDIPVLSKFRTEIGSAVCIAPYAGYYFSFNFLELKYNKDYKQSVEDIESDTRVIRFLELYESRDQHGFTFGIESAYKRFVADFRYYHSLKSIEHLGDYWGFDNRYSSISIRFGVYIGRNY